MSRRPWVILTALLLARVGFGYEFQSVASLGPGLIARLHLSYAAFGSLIGAYMLAGAFVALPLGLLGRRFGDRLVLGAGLAMMAAGQLLCALAGGTEGIAAGRLVSGIGAVAMMVLQSKVIADWFAGPRFMLAISLSSAAYPVGVGLSQIVLPPLADRFGWGAAFGSGAAEAALALALFLASYRPAPGLAKMPPGFSLPTRQEAVLSAVAGLIWTAYTACYATFLSYAPALMNARGEGLALVGLVVALATWGNVVATPAGGGLANRWGAPRVFMAGSAAIVLGVAVMGAFDLPVLCGALVGLPGSLQPGIIIALGTLSARTENRAAAMGIFFTLYYAGGALAPALCGVAADAYGGVGGAMFAGAAIGAIGVPAYLAHRALGGRTMLEAGA
ncbi:MAG: MFS transporter [Rhodospirillales bacterium]|jgi:MFS family permease|nr:MFS transporter [Rhodospirillales bacterium]